MRRITICRTLFYHFGTSQILFLIWKLFTIVNNLRTHNKTTTRFKMSQANCKSCKNVSFHLILSAYPCISKCTIPTYRNKKYYSQKASVNTSYLAITFNTVNNKNCLNKFHKDKKKFETKILFSKFVHKIWMLQDTMNRAVLKKHFPKEHGVSLQKYINKNGEIHPVEAVYHR